MIFNLYYGIKKNVGQLASVNSYICHQNLKNTFFVFKFYFLNLTNLCLIFFNNFLILDDIKNDAEKQKKGWKNRLEQFLSVGFEPIN